MGSLDSSLVVEGLSGRAYLDAATRLLTRARGEDLHAGIYEPGDVQWWWHADGAEDPERQLFWRDLDGRFVAALLLYLDGSKWLCDAFWLPDSVASVRARVWPDVLARLDAHERGAHVEIAVDARDSDWVTGLEGIGFEEDEEGAVVQMGLEADLTARSGPALPAGFRFEDATRYAPDPGAHHLAARNGARVAWKLLECSLYRPDLDLCVLAPGGEVAAYCLCWSDSENFVGLFEPVRTEAPFQRRGIGKALLLEGIRRMRAAGLRHIKVSHAAANEAARRLYRSVGFRPQFCKLRLVRSR